MFKNSNDCDICVYLYLIFSAKNLLFFINTFLNYLEFILDILNKPKLYFIKIIFKINKK